MIRSLIVLNGGEGDNSFIVGRSVFGHKIEQILQVDKDHFVISTNKGQIEINSNNTLVVKEIQEEK